MLVLVDVIVMAVVNASYLYVVLTQSNMIKSIVTVMLALFKLLWSNLILVPTLDRLHSRTALYVSLLIFNNVLIPVIVTLFVDVNCYRNVFISAVPITTTYVLPNYGCSEAIGICVPTSVLSSVTFTPPFTYSGQCSSAILTNYIPIYMLMYGIVGVVMPVLQIGVLHYFITETKTARSRWLTSVHSNLAMYKLFSGGVVCAMVLPYIVTDACCETHNSGNSDIKDKLYSLRDLAFASVVLFVVLLVSVF